VRLVPLLAVLAACSEYNLQGNKGGKTPPGKDTGVSGETGVEESDVCGEPERDGDDVGVDESCVAEAITGTFTPVIEWTNRRVGDAYTTPVVGQLNDDDGDGDIDGDDVPDVVVANTAGVVYALKGSDGSIEWSGGSLGSEPMTAAIGDLDGDGAPEVVASGVSGTVAFHGTDGSIFWSGAGATNAYCGAVGLADLDGDGGVEVLLGSLILKGKDGSTIGKGAYGSGTGYSGGWAAAMGVAADLDGDGEQEAVVGNAAYDKNGNARWTNGASDGFVAIGDFDGDAGGEVVVTSTGSVRLQDSDGTVLWTQKGVTGATSGPPTVADFDGDGGPEIGVAGNNVYVVFDADGTELWRNKVTDLSSGFTGSSVFDFEGDGAAEVVYADEEDVWVFDGATGDVKMRESTHSSATCSEYPAIADVDNDGHAEIIYTSSAYSGSEVGVTVIGDADDSWMPGRPIWNQHAYSITNVEDDGHIPKVPNQNWLSYNNFRSGDLTAATGGALTDAVPVLTDECTVECEDGLLRVVVAVGNMGTVDLPAGVALSVYSKGTLLETQYTEDDIASGETGRGMVFDLDPADVGDKLTFIADDDGGTGQISECNEANNELEVEELCP
jgi:hypothetical protein